MSSAARQIALEWDDSQRCVIEACAGERLLVDAGPGTGKTAVACARLGHLIAQGEVTASRAWMISFTRTAVAEIRARLHGYVGDAAFAVKVATVDAHAWTIHSGFDPSASLTGSYEENIERVLDLVRGDDEVLDYLQEVEHLVVDEAQDLVGRRADLVEALVSRLARECGVTVFADEAQAIYGFSEEDDAAGGGGEALLDRLRGASSLRFREIALETIHRTSAPGLRTIFSDVRSAVMRRSDGPGLFARIRDAISTNADGQDLQKRSLGLDTLPAGTLVLFRRRSEALETSQFCTVPHSLRLSGYGANLPPWIAACFHDQTDQRISHNDFLTLWSQRIEAGCTPDYAADEAWLRMARLAGGADGSLDLHLLRRALSRRGPPVDLAVPEFGLPGPILGTIHASKGREADSVLLLMPSGEEFESDVAEQEETRVLFVGSTRARRSLQVGSASAWTGSSVRSGRCYRTVSRKYATAMVEIGREEDLGPEGLVGRSLQGAATASHAQRWLARHAGVVTGYDLVQDARLDWNYRICVAGDNLSVGVASNRLRDDLWEVANRLADKPKTVRPPQRISHVHALGCRTVALAPEDPVLERLHEPWSRSGFLLAPRIAACTKLYFWRKK